MKGAGRTNLKFLLVIKAIRLLVISDIRWVEKDFSDAKIVARRGGLDKGKGQKRVENDSEAEHGFAQSHGPNRARWI